MVAILGIIVAFRGDRKRGAIVAALDGLLLLRDRVLIPGQNGIGSFYDAFFGDVGKSPTEVVVNSVRHPTKTWDLANEKDRKTWYFNMFAPWAFVPLLDIRALAVAGGAIFINIVSSFPYTRDYRFHYSAIVVAGSAVATVEAIAWISNRAKQRIPTQVAMLSAVLTAAVVASFALGCAQYSKHYKDGTWPLHADPMMRSGRGGEVGPGPGVGQRRLQHRHAHDPPARGLRVARPLVQRQLGRPRRAPRRPGDGAVPRVGPQVDQRPEQPDGDRALLSDLLSYEFVIVSEDRASWWPSACTHPCIRAVRTLPRASASPASHSTAFNRTCKPPASACTRLDGGRGADLLASSGSSGHTS